MNKQILFDRVRAMVLGHCVGDALGVPYEFKSRQALKANPATDMVGFMSHDVPPGTWSDDSSLSFCLMEALINDHTQAELMQLFRQWLHDGYWTPHGVVFDVGIRTSEAISMYQEGRITSRSRSTISFVTDYSITLTNRPLGNGSIMRIHPLAPFLLTQYDKYARIESISENNALTHQDPLTATASVILVETIRNLLHDQPFETAARTAVETSKMVLLSFIDYRDPDIRTLLADCIDILKGGKTEADIRSSGYVSDTLTAVFWCLKNSTSYREAVLKAVNLGEDTDTIAAITGAIAGIIYGLDSIPLEWINQLARLDDIHNLIDRYNEKLESRISA